VLHLVQGCRFGTYPIYKEANHQLQVQHFPRAVRNLGMLAHIYTLHYTIDLNTLLRRWCKSSPDYCAVSSRAPQSGAVIYLYNLLYMHAPPTIVNIAPRPLVVSDYDFVSISGSSFLAVAVNTQLTVVPAKVESQ
jgi:hypothetical protein